MKKTKSIEEEIRKTKISKKETNRCFNVISVWECQKPVLNNIFFEKQINPFPYFVVFDFEAMLPKTINQEQTKDLTFNQIHIPIFVGMNDNFSNEAVFLIDSDPKKLIKKFVKSLQKKRKAIVEKMMELHPPPDDFKFLPLQVQNNWMEWLEQLPVFGFNSSSYDLNLINKYFVKTLSDVNVAKKGNSYMYLKTKELQFLDIKNYLAPGISYGNWCKAMKVGYKTDFSL